MSDLDELYDRIGRMSKRIEKLEQRLDGMNDRIERLEEWQKTFSEDSDTFGKVLADFDERVKALEEQLEWLNAWVNEDTKGKPAADSASAALRREGSDS